MRKIFVALAAALLVSAGNAVSLRQFQARDTAALAAPQNNDQRPTAPRDGGEQPPRPRGEEEEKRPPRPPRREEPASDNEELSSASEGEEPFEEVKEYNTFAQKN